MNNQQNQLYNCDNIFQHFPISNITKEENNKIIRAVESLKIILLIDLIESSVKTPKTELEIVQLFGEIKGKAVLLKSLLTKQEIPNKDK